MGSVTFSKYIQERTEDNKEAFIFLHNTEQRDYQYFSPTWRRYVDYYKIHIGMVLDTSYKEIRNYRNEFVKNELSINIGSLSDNNPIRKPISIWPYKLPMNRDPKVLHRLTVKFVYENGEWKIQENIFNSAEDFVKDILWYSLRHHRQLFKQLREEIEKHPNQEHFHSMPKSILGFPAIREAMQKLLDSNVKIEGDAPNAQMSGAGLIHLYRQKMSVDEMEEQLLMEDPLQKRYEERERAARQLVTEARNHPQKIAHGQVGDTHVDLLISDNF